MVRRPRSPSGAYGLWVFAGAMLAVLGHSPAALSASLGNNLSDEACEAAARDDIAPEAGLPPDLKVRCNDRDSGAVVYSRFFAGDRKGDDLRAALIDQYKGTRAFKLLQQRMTCREGTWFGEGLGIHAVPCNLKDGGWPHLVVIGAANGLLSVADGPPSNWPVLQKTVTGKDAQGSKAELSGELKTVWGGPVVLATAGDLSRFKQLLRGAGWTQAVPFSMSGLLLAVAILSEVIATSALKASNGFSRPGPSLLVAIGYGISFYCLSLTLRTIPVGIVYAVWSGVGLALITLIGWLVFGQVLDAAAWLGLALIASGVLVIHLFSRGTSALV